MKSLHFSQTRSLAWLIHVVNFSICIGLIYLLNFYWALPMNLYGLYDCGIHGNGQVSVSPECLNQTMKIGVFFKILATIVLIMITELLFHFLILHRDGMFFSPSSGIDHTEDIPKSENGPGVETNLDRYLKKKSKR